MAQKTRRELADGDVHEAPAQLRRALDSSKSGDESDADKLVDEITGGKQGCD